MAASEPCSWTFSTLVRGGVVGDVGGGITFGVGTSSAGPPTPHPRASLDAPPARLSPTRAHTHAHARAHAVGMFTKAEIDDIVKIGYLNGLFVLARSIGLIGHCLDQKRLGQPLYRHPWDDVLYTK